MQKRIEKRILEIAAKYKLPKETVVAIFESQFQCAREEIKKAVAGEPETFKNIRFRNLGLLVSRSRKIIKIHETATRHSTD